MNIEETTRVERKAVFTRAELMEKLGIDIRDFFLAELPVGSDTLVLRYSGSTQ